MIFQADYCSLLTYLSSDRVLTYFFERETSVWHVFENIDGAFDPGIGARLKLVMKVLKVVNGMDCAVFTVRLSGVGGDKLFDEWQVEQLE